ncbi:hypothetical protein NODU109028_08745 [Nocardioides dubius]|uniref:Ig-like domain-containing protein n=1 Tax=Nocardioides dubius TaxID=317019 RepID=A0ABN1TUM8_9ACTN
MRLAFASTVVLAATAVVVPSAPVAATTYVGDWRMTVHQMNEEYDYCEGGVCGTTFHIRTNQPVYEAGGDWYEVEMFLDGEPLYGDTGRSDVSHIDPSFAGVRAIAQTGELAKGVHTLRLDWYYQGVWTCGPAVPEGCAWVGRERVKKTYKFRWAGGADQTVRPYRVPASSVSIKAARSGAKVRVSGTVKAQRLRSDYSLNTAYSPVRAARVTLQSYSTAKRKWVNRTTVRSTKRGVVSARITTRSTKLRWVVAAKSGAYASSRSKAVRR